MKTFKCGKPGCTQRFRTKNQFFCEKHSVERYWPIWSGAKFSSMESHRSTVADHSDYMSNEVLTVHSNYSACQEDEQ